MGTSDGTARMVLVEQASRAGVETNNFKTWYQLAAYAIRMGAIHDETADRLTAEIKDQNLDPYVTVDQSLDCDKLIDTDDARDTDCMGDETKCIGLSACGGPCDDSCPAHRAS